MSTAAFKRELLRDLADMVHDPLGFVMWAFPWGNAGTSLADEEGPEEWQAQQLREIGESLQADPYDLIREVIASGHGIGKSTEVAWLVLWAVMTFPDCRGVVTANTETQLRTKTWPEVAKWFSLLRFPELREMFDLQATSIASVSVGHEKNWRVDAIPWSERNTEAFAGLHNSKRRIVVIFDEGSAIVDLIWEVAEGALTDAETEIIWLVYGNATRNTGRFKESVSGKFRHQWKHRQIDSREVRRTNKPLLKSWVETYGDDSDFVRVRVKGQFPRASTLQFIGSDVVADARTREVVPGLASDPIIFGVDCARFGDDHSTLAIRKGRDARSIPWKRWYKQDAMLLAGDIALEAERWKPDAIFVDAGNIGAAVVDRLRQIGLRNVYEVWFGGNGREAIWAGDHRVKTMNKRSEMWTNMRAWLAHGTVPDDDDLETDLTGVEYGYGPDQTSIQLEKKEHMKARGLASPDDADALACTFAEPVMPRVTARLDPASYIEAGSNYDRFAELG